MIALSARVIRPLFVFALLSTSGMAWAKHITGPTERRLHLAFAEASSYLVNDWNKFSENYLPLYIGDDDAQTAWTLKTEGINEWIRMRVTPMEGATKVRFRIRNGYQKSPRLFAANARARSIKVVLLPSRVETLLELKDASGWQEISVEQPTGAMDGVEFHIQSVYPGKKYDDLCLSDVQVHVTATSTENPAYEKQRYTKILTWKGERLAAAKLFQSNLAKTLPMSAAYSLADELKPLYAGIEDTVDQKCKEEICRFDSLFATALNFNKRDQAPQATLESLATAKALAFSHFAQMLPVRVSSRDKRKLPRVDGLCSFQLNECLEDPCYESLPMPAQLGLLNAQSLLVVEQPQLPSVKDVLALTPAACHQRNPTTFFWITRAPATADGQPGLVVAMLAITCSMVEGREEAFPKASPQLLVYDASGVLDIIASDRYVAAYKWDRTTADLRLAQGYVTRSSSDTAWTIQARSIVASP